MCNLFWLLKWSYFLGPVFSGPARISKTQWPHHLSQAVGNQRRVPEMSGRCCSCMQGNATTTAPDGFSNWPCTFSNFLFFHIKFPAKHFPI